VGHVTESDGTASLRNPTGAPILRVLPAQGHGAAHGPVQLPRLLSQILAAHEAGIVDASNTSAK